MDRCCSWKLSGCHVITESGRLPHLRSDWWCCLQELLPLDCHLRFHFSKSSGEKKILGSGAHLGSILVKGICFSFPFTARKLSSIPRKMINDSTRKPKAYELLYFLLLLFFFSLFYLWTDRLFPYILAWDTQNSRNLPSSVSWKACRFYWLTSFLAHLNNYSL